MKQMLLILPLLTVGCTTQPTQDTTQQPSAQAYLPYKEEIPKEIREKPHAAAPLKQSKYLFDDTPVGSSLERDSGSFLNQQKRQMDIQREHLRQ